MDNQDLATTGKRKMKPRGGNSPMIGDNGLDLEPGDNTKFITFNLQVSAMPKIDMTDGEQVTERIADYFGLCARYDIKPAVSGLALALGTDRRRLWEIARDNEKALNVSVMSSDAIKKAYQNLDILWEQYMLHGKINPMAGVFLGVNNHGYHDVKQFNITPTPANPLGTPRDIKEIEAFAASMPED